MVNGVASGHIVLAVSGSIAAYKAAVLASSLVQSGCEVEVVLTSGGARFVTPLTFEAITRRAVHRTVWDELPGSSRMGHIALSRWADVVAVAPASANTLARLSLGFGDDLLSAVVLASTVPLVLAPAMESSMWRHPATQEHVSRLRERGAIVIGPESGRLASGASGEGRMAEPETIARNLLDVLGRRANLAGHRVLVTAGPTIEPIDPVRFIGNRSSGKMGYAVAEEARDRGAEVVLVSGPTALPDPYGITVLHVETAAQMQHAVLEHISGCGIAIMAAAVSDFTPAAPASEKLKRHGHLTLDLEATPDIAAAAARAEPACVQVGFALETGNAVHSAREKLVRKGQSMVVANQVSTQFSPFGSNTNRVSLVFADRDVTLPEMSKREIAGRILDEAAQLVGNQSQRDR